MPLAPPSLFLKLIGLTSARSLGVRHTSFSAQPPDLPSWFYVCLLGFGLCCNLTRHLALYQVSVRRLVRLATPLLPSQPRGFRLAVHYTWRQIPVTGLSPARCASCPTQSSRCHLTLSHHPACRSALGGSYKCFHEPYCHRIEVFLHG